MKVLTVVLVFCTISGSYGSTVNLNEAVDILLAGLRVLIVAEGKDQVVVPNVDQQWQETIAKIFKVTCSLTCSGGWVKQLSSLKRMGNVTLTISGNKAALQFRMGFEELRVHYNKCRFYAKHLGSMSREVNMSTTEASVDALVTVVLEDNSCHVSVDHIYVSNLGEIKIDIGGTFNKMEKKIVELLTKHFKKNVKSDIDDHLQSLASKAAIQGEKICSKIPF